MSLGIVQNSFLRFISYSPHCKRYRDLQIKRIVDNRIMLRDLNCVPITAMIHVKSLG